MHGVSMEHKGMDRLSVPSWHLGVHHVYILMVFLPFTHEPTSSVAISITVPWDIELHSSCRLSVNQLPMNQDLYWIGEHRNEMID